MRPLMTAILLITSILSLVPVAQANEPSRPIVLEDDTSSDRDFAQFRRQLTSLVQARDAQGLAKVLPGKGLSIGFTRPTSIKDLKLQDPDARLWHILDYTLAHTCGRSGVPNSQDWICPTVARDFLRQYPRPNQTSGVEYEIKQVVVLGKDVNVRSQPRLGSSVIAQLTNEVVRPNPKVKSIFDINNPQLGWQSVLLPNGQTGFVSNRYAYFPLGYYLNLAKVNGTQWQITQILSGE
jgi:hypothetical protein